MDITQIIITISILGITTILILVGISIINLLKEFNQSQELDGTRRGNRFAAKRVIEKIRKEFTVRVKREPIDNEIINSMKAI